MRDEERHSRLSFHPSSLIPSFIPSRHTERACQLIYFFTWLHNRHYGVFGVSTMLAQLRTFALLGIDAVPVEVEVDTHPAQMPKTVIVGLPELTVRESIHRIERALVNLGYRLPTGRTVVNLAPADLRKDANAFDLPIAIGILISTGQIIGDHIAEYASVGELALDGSVRPIAGALSMAMEARAREAKRLIVPAANAREAAVVREVEVYGVTSLVEAIGIVVGAAGVEPMSPTMEEVEGKLNKYDIDFADVKEIGRAHV